MPVANGLVGFADSVSRGAVSSVVSGTVSAVVSGTVTATVVSSVVSGAVSAGGLRDGLGFRHHLLRQAGRDPEHERRAVGVPIEFADTRGVCRFINQGIVLTPEFHSGDDGVLPQILPVEGTVRLTEEYRTPASLRFSTPAGLLPLQIPSALVCPTPIPW